MQWVSHSAEEMQAYAARFVASLSPREGGATVVALSGQLGAGKTTFTQGAAKALGVEEVVTSPTFVIEKVYALTEQSFGRLIHIDAYRLESAHQLEVLEWEELLADPGNLILIEWPEQVPGAIPAGAAQLSFIVDGDTRVITRS